MNLAEQIEQAIREGRVQRIPAGASGLPPRKPREEKPTRFHAELCGKGERLGRLPRLDELDGDWR